MKSAILFGLSLWAISLFSASPPNLPTNRIYPIYPLNNNRIYPLNNKGKGILQEYLERIQLKSPSFQKLINGKFTFSGSRVISRFGLPELPVMIRRFSVPNGYKATARLENIKIQKIEIGGIELKKGNKPYYWSKMPAFSPPKVGRYFPGDFLRQLNGDGELLVSLYPYQYDLEKNELLILSSFDIKLDLEKLPQLTRTDSSDSIILTSSSLSEGALSLKKFHNDHLKISSEIIFVEDIEKNEPPIDEKNLPDGYKENGSTNSGVIKFDEKSKTGYNYNLAKKIMTFLYKKINGGKLKYITILGDSLIVPPSYYFSIRSAYDSTFGVTDACYGAINKCLEPKAAIGRLPFSTNEEIKNYIDKIERWLKYSNNSESELSLYGGKAFPGLEFIGEIGTLRLQYLNGANWKGLKKYFRTKNNYSKEEIENLVEGKKHSSFVYYLDHGTGNRLYVEEDNYISSDEILAKNSSGEFSNPFIASISCSNAAFDRELVESDIFNDSNSKTKSIGESLLLSKAGAVAYMGSLRPALGQPIYNVDSNGNLHITGSTHSMELLELFYENYLKHGEGRAGALQLEAIRTFLVLNDVTKDDAYLYSYFNFAFLGDPVLQLPSRKKVENAYSGAKSVTVFNGLFQNGCPFFNISSQMNEFSLDLETTTDVTSSLFKVPTWISEKEMLVKESQLRERRLKYTVEAQKDSEKFVYLLKLENIVGMPFESRIWFGVNKDERITPYLVENFN